MKVVNCYAVRSNYLYAEMRQRWHFCSLFAICEKVILLKLLTIQEPDWKYRKLPASLSIAISEVSESLVRSHLAGLIDESRRNVHLQSLMEFLAHGIRYVFPQVPGSMVTGIPTAHSHPSINSILPVSLIMYGRMRTELCGGWLFSHCIKVCQKHACRMNFYTNCWQA